MTQPRRTLAPGKAMLIGEYAVLEGSKAVVAAVDCYATAQLSGGSPSSPFISAAMRETLSALTALGMIEAAEAQATSGLVPFVDTGSFSVGGRKLGVGSSASATVAAVGALLASAGLDLQKTEVRQAVQLAATRAHDSAQGVRGSGADVLAATWGGLRVLHDPSLPVEKPLPELPAHLCFVATSTSVSTSALLSRYRQLGSAVSPAIATLTEAATRFVAAWLAGQRGALLDAVAQSYQGYLQLENVLERTLVTTDHLQIAAAAHSVGGVAKPSGAGGGDLAVVFLPEASSEAALAAALPPGLMILSLKVSPLGLHTLESE